MVWNEPCTAFITTTLCSKNGPCDISRLFIFSCGCLLCKTLVGILQKTSLKNTVPQRTRRFRAGWLSQQKTAAQRPVQAKRNHSVAVFNLEQIRRRAFIAACGCSCGRQKLPFKKTEPWQPETPGINVAPLVLYWQRVNTPQNWAFNSCDIEGYAEAGVDQHNYGNGPVQPVQSQWRVRIPLKS